MIARNACIFDRVFCFVCLFTRNMLFSDFGSVMAFKFRGVVLYSASVVLFELRVRPLESFFFIFCMVSVIWRLTCFYVLFSSKRSIYSIL